jgi:hypothetical protein
VLKKPVKIDDRIPSEVDNVAELSAGGKVVIPPPLVGNPVSADPSPKNLLAVTVFPLRDEN